MKKLILTIILLNNILLYAENNKNIDKINICNITNNKIRTNEKKLNDSYIFKNKSLIITNILLNIKDQIISELNNTNETFVTLVWIDSFSINSNSTFAIYSLPNHGMIYQKISFIKECNKIHPNHIELAGTYCGVSQGMTNREADDYWYLDFDYNNKIINTMTNSYKCWIGVNYAPPMCSSKKYIIQLFDSKIF